MSDVRVLFLKFNIYNTPDWTISFFATILNLWWKLLDVILKNVQGIE